MKRTSSASAPASSRTLRPRAAPPPRTSSGGLGLLPPGTSTLVAAYLRGS